MKYVFLYFPFIVSWSLVGIPELAYGIAWLGSIVLVFLIFSGILRPQGYVSSWIDHPLRPLFVPHLIFAGYMSISSIFYFWSLYGYVYLEKINLPASQETFELTALAQSLYYLGHAALVHGLLNGSNYVKPNSGLRTKSITSFSLQLSIVFTILAFGISAFPQLGQLSDRVIRLSMVAAAIALALAIPERSISGLLFSLAIFGLNMFQALISGWKESIITPFILLGAFLLPVYRFKILFLMVPFLVVLLVVLPTFNIVFRNNAWEKQTDQREALQKAVNAVRSQEGIKSTNWDFLTGRLSEINFFCKYLANVPKNRDYYGTQILEQGIESLIPRILIPNKGITENLVMQRVWENKVVEEISIVSAKPQIIVDGYLSFGIIGAWLFCFFTGWSAARISVFAEQLFGGYFLGTGIIFSSLFNVYWRGNCFEFMINPIFWSLVVMIALYYIFILMKIIDSKT